MPEPLGTVARFHMTLQRKVAGVLATDCLARTPSVAPRVAEAITKLQRSELELERRHTVTDELAILNKQLGALSAARPDLAPRLDAVLAASRELAATLPAGELACLHRDFYPDQMLIADSRLYMLDLDLLCYGDPALDAGNFLAHLTEMALRNHGCPRHYQVQEQAFENAYKGLNQEVSKRAIEIYYVLTIVRHIAISQRIASRRFLTSALLRFAEQLLGCDCKGTGFSSEF